MLENAIFQFRTYVMNEGISLTGSVLALMLCSWSVIVVNDELVA